LGGYDLFRSKCHGRLYCRRALYAKCCDSGIRPDIVGDDACCVGRIAIPFRGDDAQTAAVIQEIHLNATERGDPPWRFASGFSFLRNE
jgi:hypothetical protein